MARKNAQPAPQTDQPEQTGITRITVSGFKSIIDEQSIDIKPLTILAGANSSGKTSIMQPLLLLKQTLEAPYNPGPLMLDGPNVNFSEAEQLLSRTIDGYVEDIFSVGIALGENRGVVTFLKKSESELFEVEKTIYKDFVPEYCIRADMSLEELSEMMYSHVEQLTSLTLKLLESRASSENANTEYVEYLRQLVDALRRRLTNVKESFTKAKETGKYPFSLSQNRCFLSYTSSSGLTLIDPGTLSSFPPEQIINNYLHQMLHLPGLRGNPQRTYPIIPLGPNFTNFSGRFETYTASVIHDWQKNKKQEKLDQLNRDLARLGLTNKIVARQITSAHVELLVNRLLHGKDGAEDMVNIVDVGFGVSQAVPVVVALHAAEPGQLVYIEQPEIHLHPRAQVGLTEILADAAQQDKRVIIETHSDLIITGIQSLVAEGRLPSELVKLHWFEQLPNGFSKITSADLDKVGAFGDWPEDFHKVILAAENRYLNAAEAHLLEE